MNAECKGCPLINYRFLTESGGTPSSSFTSKISFNAENNIEVKTDNQFTETFYVEGYFDEV